MSDWLSVIIVILIISIVLDGIRRARNARRNQIRLSRNAIKADRALEDEASNELLGDFPSGGARPKHEEAVSPAPAGDTPVQTSLELDEPVPMLMDSVVNEGADTRDASDEAPEAEYSDAQLEPSIGALEDLDAPTEPKPRPAEPEEASFESRMKAKAGQFFSHKKSTESQQEEKSSKAPSHAGPQEILIVNIMARSGTVFDGQALLNALTAEALKFGQMNIFHRHLENDGDAPVVYSLANIVEPGNFDFANMADTTTPGVCIFLSLPTTCEAHIAYEDMIRTARNIAAALDGELKDENRSALTNQTIEHGRQRVLEFERKIKLGKH